MSLEEKIEYLENFVESKIKENWKLKKEILEAFTITPEEWQEYFSTRHSEFTVIKFSAPRVFRVNDEAFERRLINITAIIPTSEFEHYRSYFHTWYDVSNENDFNQLVCKDVFGEDDGKTAIVMFDCLVLLGSAYLLRSESYSVTYYDAGDLKGKSTPMSVHRNPAEPIGCFERNEDGSLSFAVFPEFLRESAFAIARQKMEPQYEQLRIKGF